MTAVRNGTIIVSAFLACACVSVGNIQETEPIRTLTFTGSPRAVAHCVQSRVGGKLQDGSVGESFVIYDSVKGKAGHGLTHYSITVGKGLAEWRVMRPKGSSAPPPLSEELLRVYWKPVEDCAALAKPS